MEERTFIQYLEQGEINNYKIIIQTDFLMNSKIYIDFTLFTGEAEININNYQNGDINKY